MDTEALIRRLMTTFLAEFEDHTRALDRDLLAFERSPTPELLKSMFRTVHSLKGAAHSVNVTVVQSTCHHLESILGAARDGRLELDSDLIQLLFTAADGLGDASQRLREGVDLVDGPLIELGARLEAVEAVVRDAQPNVARATRAHPPEVRAADGSVRLQAAKLDWLLDRAGESFVARRRASTQIEAIDELVALVAQLQVEWHALERVAGPSERGGQQLKELSRRLDGLGSRIVADQHALDQTTGQLEDQVRRLRMQPFTVACESLDRAIRDLARAIGVEAELVVEGGSIELDRAILESLGDSLLQLVRNAVAHGLEPAAERVASGKLGQGRITIAAELRGAGVDVTVADDGRGLDLGQLADAARARGLAVPDDQAELARLIFVDGLSTTRRVDDLSGRGIGLDVVKHRVESLRGSVSVWSAPGLGTRFVLSLPLTLTTVRGLLVECSGHSLILPSASVTRLTREDPSRFARIDGRAVLLGGPEPIPVAELDRVLGLGPSSSSSSSSTKSDFVTLAIVRIEPRQVAFVVGELIEEQDFVIKPLGPRFENLTTFAGVTMLPTGRFAPILNLDAVVSIALSEVLARSSRESTAQDSARQRRILVVDDSVTTRGLEKLLLEAAGYHVIVAADGVAAWQRLEAEGADLVVSDVEMPRMDGFALVEAIRGSSRFRSIPVILVTALETEQDRARGLALGADAYLPKSKFDQRQLIEVISSLL